MRSLTLLLLAVVAFFDCASQTPPTGQQTEANNFCTERCEEEMGDEALYSCDVLCECVVDALADLYPDKDVATLLAMLDAGQQDSTPDLDKVGRDCALQSSLMPNSGLDPYSAAWYSKHLEAAGESRIEPTGREDAEVYRLLVLPSFTSTIVVRVERLGNQITYTTKRLSGAGGYEPGEIEWQADGTMPNADWTELKRLLLTGDFWSQPSQDALDRLRRERCEQGDESACWMGLDGTTFVLEGADRSRYQLVDRWEEFEPPLESAVELLLAISGNKSE
jgi:hypothetical protein